MTEPFVPRDPKKTIQPGDDVHNAPTLPQHEAVRTPSSEPLDTPPRRERPRTITNLEIFDLLESTARENARGLGDVKRGLRDLGNEVGDLRRDQREDRARIAKLEAGNRAARGRAPSISDRETPEEASALSTDERFERLDRAALRAKEEAERAREASEDRARRNKLHTALVGFAVVLLGALGNYATTRLTTPDVVRDAVKDTAPIIEGATKKAIEETKP